MSDTVTTVSPALLKFFNGHDPENALAKDAVQDILNSGLSPEFLESFCVKLYNGTVDELQSTVSNPAVTAMFEQKKIVLVEFPYLNSFGEKVFSRYKILPAIPGHDGKLIKYFQPTGIATKPYCPIGISDNIDQRDQPLLLTEGEKKALAVFQTGIPCIGLTGVWNFRENGFTDNDSFELPSEIRDFKLDGRSVYLAFDADFFNKQQVRFALYELALRLLREGADVFVILWDPKFKGVDDYLAQFSNPRPELDKVMRNAKPLFEFIQPKHELEVVRAIAIAGFTRVRESSIIKEVAKPLKSQVRTLQKAVEKKKGYLQRKPTALSPNSPTPADSDRIKSIRLKNGPGENIRAYEVDRDTTYVAMGKQLFVGPVPPIEFDSEEDLIRCLKTIADFDAKIVEEMTAEDGEPTYKIEVASRTGGTRCFQISAKDFAESKGLKGLLGQAAGLNHPIYPGLEQHLGPCIQKLSPFDDVTKTVVIKRFGWLGDTFLIDGRTPPSIHVQKGNFKKMVYRIDPNANLELALRALEKLIICRNPQVTLPVLTSIFQAPLSKILDWGNYRSAVFVQGQTGSLKTSFIRRIMCIFGPDFKLDENLIAMGDKATMVSILLNASFANDLPFFIDNYKPNTVKGKFDFPKLITSLVEGTDKDRGAKEGGLRDTRKIETHPIFSGEDIPDLDASSTARLLPVRFGASFKGTNQELLFAQDNSDHLCAVGGTWLDHLEVMKGADSLWIRNSWKEQFLKNRDEWAGRLLKLNPTMPNSLRAATI